MLIDARFQGRIVFFIILSGALCVGVTAYLSHAYIVDSYDFILRHSRLPQELIDARYRELSSFLVSMSLINLLIVLVVATWAFFITHRAAGSVYHIRRVIREIRTGNAGERVHLREKDEFQDLASAFNELMDHVQRR